MGRARKPLPPQRETKRDGPVGILELERFSEATLKQWNAASADLDELNDELFFSVQPEQRRLRPQLLEALKTTAPAALQLQRWARIITYRYSDEPLSAAGSLQQAGGRFNVGREMDEGTLHPWPALYVAEDYETAFREKFQLGQSDRAGGLTPKELALESGVSHATVFVQGELLELFDLTSVQALEAVARIFRRIKMPARARQLKAKLRIPNRDLGMVQTAQQLHNAVLKHNWRVGPIQFGLPAPSQILAELVRAAGYEGILYRSTKGGGRCIAVFPDLLKPGSHIELIDDAPAAVRHQRLDLDSAQDLAGWDGVPARLRPSKP